MKAAELPAPMQSMNEEQRTKFLDGKAHERADLQKRIADLSQRRDQFIAAERKKQAAGPKTFDDAVTSSVRTEAESGGLRVLAACVGRAREGRRSPTYTAASRMNPANIVPTIFKITGARGGRSACAFATYSVCAIVTARCNPRSARASPGSASFLPPILRRCDIEPVDRRRQLKKRAVRRVVRPRLL